MVQNNSRVMGTEVHPGDGWCIHGSNKVGQPRFVVLSKPVHQVGGDGDLQTANQTVQWSAVCAGLSIAHCTVQPPKQTEYTHAQIIHSSHACTWIHVCSSFRLSVEPIPYGWGPYACRPYPTHLVCCI